MKMNMNMSMKRNNVENSFGSDSNNEIETKESESY